MALERLTRIGSSGISTNASIVTNNINSTGIVTATEFHGDGSNLTGISGGGGGISNVVEDTTPQLGGNLDVNGKDITGTGSVNLTGIVTATSFVGDGSGLTGISGGGGISQALAIAYSIAL